MAALLSLDTRSLATDAWLAVVIAGCIAAIVLFVLAVISVVRSPRLTGTGRLLWILGLLVVPVVGSLAWFMFGRRRSAELYRDSS